jgi:hypothetical protein
VSGTTTRSKMTERQFRELLAKPYGGISSAPFAIIQHGVYCAREAGIEFAPEPVTLPATFGVIRERELGLRDTGTGTLLSHDQGREICRRAMLYPGLRERALALCIRLDALGGVSGLDGYVSSLRAELHRRDTQ